MQIRTLLINYQPLNLSDVKGAQLKRHQYFQETLASFNLGEVFYLPLEEAKTQIHKLNPLVVVAFDEHTAREIKEIKSDHLTYVIDTPNRTFSRKADIEERQEKLERTLTEASALISEVLNGDREEKDLRLFASLSYKELYKMITKALVHEDEDISNQAKELLFGDGDRPENIVWMRAQIMVETWQNTDWKGRESLMCSSMEKHIEQGTARKMDSFVDEDGLEYHQYMFLDPWGNDLKHIRRLPFATRGQSLIEYENLLEKNEIPTNFLRIQVEANQLKDHWDEYLKREK